MYGKYYILITMEVVYMYVLISQICRHVDASPLTPKLGDIQTTDKGGHVIECGYITCDGTYQYCNTGYGRPECSRCSGICSKYRVANNKEAIARCITICPEYWIRTHPATTTKTSIQAAQQTPSSPSATQNNDKRDSTSEQYVHLHSIIIIILIVLVTLLIGIVGVLLYNKRTTVRNMEGRKSSEYYEANQRVDTADESTSMAEQDHTIPFTPMNELSYKKQSNTAATQGQPCSARPADGTIVQNIIASPSDGQGLAPIVTHVGKSLPFKNNHLTYCSERDKTEGKHAPGPSRNEERIASNISKLLSMDTSIDETFAKRRMPMVECCLDGSESKSSGDSENLMLDLASDVEDYLPEKSREARPLFNKTRGH